MIHYGGTYYYDDANPCDEIYFDNYDDYYYNETKPLYLPGPEAFLEINSNFEMVWQEVYFVAEGSVQILRNFYDFTNSVSSNTLLLLSL